MSLLARAERLVLRGARRQQYGEPVAHLERVAAVWTALAGQRFTARDVAVMLAAMKLVRESHRHDPDNLTDAAGYVLIADLAARDGS